MRKLSLLVLLFVTACAARGESYQSMTPPVHSRIIVYREPAMVGSLMSVSIELDGKHIADLDENMYATVEVTPGKHHLKATYPSLVSREKDIDVIIGERDTKYFTTGWHTTGLVGVGFVGGFNMGEVDKEDAEVVLKNMYKQHV